MTTIDAIIMFVLVYNLIPVLVTVVVLPLAVLLVRTRGYDKELIVMYSIIFSMVLFMFVIVPVIITPTTDLIWRVTRVMKHTHGVSPVRYTDHILLVKFNSYWKDGAINTVERFSLYYDLKNHRYMEDSTEAKEKEDKILKELNEVLNNKGVTNE